MNGKFFIICLVLLASSIGMAQDVNQGSGTNQEVIDLTREAIRIERRIEMPRVRIFDRRIPPKFDELTMKRSFMPEIMGKNEELKVLVNKKLTVKPVKNVTRILEKKR